MITADMLYRSLTNKRCELFAGGAIISGINFQMAANLLNLESEDMKQMLERKEWMEARINRLTARNQELSRELETNQRLCRESTRELQNLIGTINAWMIINGKPEGK